ncbi:hypothetical protein ACJDT4_09430 [Clostridium neuense]|uniref:Uncharacterized protein n=1 Tax=Clostridium neuense TaxID=1728934 RepID=A0ABW8TG36_9CLOT
MSSSKEEIFEAFKPFIEKGIVGIVSDLKEDRECSVLYNKMSSLDKVLTSKEFWMLQPSKNEIEARKSGCNTDDEIIEYCDAIYNIKKEEAMKTGMPVKCDTIGMFSCKDIHEDCSWDIVYVVVNPSGEFLYIREHCY